MIWNIHRPKDQLPLTAEVTMLAGKVKVSAGGNGSADLMSGQTRLRFTTTGGIVSIVGTRDEIRELQRAIADLDVV